MKPVKFLDEAVKNKMKMKPKEDEGTFEQELHVLKSDETTTAEQFCIWLKEFHEELIVP